MVLPASAAQITQTFSFGPTAWNGQTFDLNGNQTNPGNYAGGTTNNITYNKFNPALGTLTGVSVCITVTGTGNSMCDYYNWNGTAGLPDVDVTNDIGVKFSIPSNGNDGWLNAAYSPIIDSVQAVGTQTFTVPGPPAPGAWVMSPQDYPTAQINYMNTFDMSNNLSSWIGAGTHSTTVTRIICQNASYSPVPPGGGNTTGQSAINTHWENVSSTITIEIKYDYTSDCEVTSIDVTPGACNNNGTPNDQSDDYYLGSVTVHYSGKPATGNLVLSGPALHSSNTVSTVAVGSAGANSHTFNNVRIVANGISEDLTASFTADAACTLTVQADSVPNCSIPDCDMTSIVVTPGACNNNGTNNDESDDYYTASVTVSYSSKPSSGTLNLSGSALHYSNSVSSVAVGAAGASSHTFNGVRLLANGSGNDLTATFSADTNCTLTITANSIDECSTPDCDMTGIDVVPGACNNNGTNNDETDDYYTATVTVNYTNKPASGTLFLSGYALHPSNSVNTATVGIIGATSHVFNNVKLRADGNLNDLTATFSADPSCTITINADSIPECSTPDCDMTSIDIVAGACNNNGTNNDESDDYYTASVTVYYNNKPATGNLVLSGFALHYTNSVNSVTVGAAGATSHTFNNVRLNANGFSDDVTATFSADPSCTHTTFAPSIDECSTPDCDMTDIVVTPGACNNNGTNNDEADDFYTADVTVFYSNKPASGNLVLSGVALHSSNVVTTVTVGAAGGTSHTFTNVRLKANGLLNAITATFSADIDCTHTENAPSVNECSVPDCIITNVDVSPGACNDNGSPNDQADDYYTGNVTVTFANKPATGNLVLSGVALHSSNSVTTIAVGSTSTATSHTFTGVRLKANGVANNLTATFSADPACTMTVAADSVPNCSTPDCVISSLDVTPGSCSDNGTNNDETDDYYTATVTVNFINKPATGNLVLSGAALHSSNSVTTIAVGSTSTANSHVFANVRLKANGVSHAITATFSADAACTITVNAPSVNECSTPDCDVTDIVVTPGACNNNSTPNDSTDDYYTASVTVSFANKPASGNLVLSGAALHSTNSVSTVAVGATTSATTHTFAGVRLKANGSLQAITATFSSDPACTHTEDAPSVNSCSTPDCALTDLVVTPGACNDNGTPNNTTDDYYTASVTATFTNKPATGDLVLSGVALHSSNAVSTVQVGSTTSATSHTFVGVRLKANGVANAITATFSADPICTRTVNAASVPTCSTPVAGCCPQLIIDVP